MSSVATTYYVATGGNDGAAGTTVGTAWATLQHAANVVVAGDTVITLPGHYKGFYLSQSGLPGAPITFTANPGQDAPNPLVVVDSNNSITIDRVNLEGVSWVVVEGFTVLGSGNPATNRAGIRAVGFDDQPAAHVTLRANRCDSCGRWGIFTAFADDLLVEHNETSRAAAEHGIYVSNSGDRPIVRANRVWGNHSNGVHMNGDLSEGGDGVISGALVERNVIYENGNGTQFGAPGGSAINCDGVQSSRIQNNLLYANHKSGISLYRIDGGAPSNDNVVVGNTVHNASDSRYALNIKDGSKGNRVYDNVLLNDHAFHGSIDIESTCLSGFVCDYNLLDEKLSLDDNLLSLAAWKAATGQDAHSLLAQPSQLFVDSLAADYHLLAGATAVNAGTSVLAPLDDIEGKHRPALGAFDIGAYEFGACLGSVSSYGVGIAGSGATLPQLSASGCPDQGATLTIAVSNGLGGAFGLLVLGATQLSLPAFGGTLLASPELVHAHVLGGAVGSAGAGTSSMSFVVPVDMSLQGVSLFLQSGYVDAGAVQGVSATAGLHVDLQ